MARNPNRAHVATGKKPGANLLGKPGPGRPPGSGNGGLTNAEIAAIKAAKWRIAKDTPEPIAALANSAFLRIADVMHGKVGVKRGPAVLKAATEIRNEICGPQVRKTEVTGADGGALTVTVRTLPASPDQLAEVVTAQLPVTIQIEDEGD